MLQLLCADNLSFVLPLLPMLVSEYKLASRSTFFIRFNIIQKILTRTRDANIKYTLARILQARVPFLSFSLPLFIFLAVYACVCMYIRISLGPENNFVRDNEFPSWIVVTYFEYVAKYEN